MSNWANVVLLYKHEHGFEVIAGDFTPPGEESFPAIGVRWPWFPAAPVVLPEMFALPILTTVLTELGRAPADATKDARRKRVLVELERITGK